MMTIDEIKKALSDRNISAVSKASGVSYGTLIGITSGRQENPTYKTIKAISEYLEKKTNG